MKPVPQSPRRIIRPPWNDPVVPKKENVISKKSRESPNEPPKINEKPNQKNGPKGEIFQQHQIEIREMIRQRRLEFQQQQKEEEKQTQNNVENNPLQDLMDFSNDMSEGTENDLVEMAIIAQLFCIHLLSQMMMKNQSKVVKIFLSLSIKVRN